MKRQEKTGDMKLVKVYLPEGTKEQLQELSAEQQKSVSFIVSELINKELELIIRLDLKLDEGKN